MKVGGDFNQALFPVEMPDGSHVTRYGNRYAHNEWAAKCESDKVNVTHEDARAAARRDMIDELGKWIQADKVGFVANLIESYKLADAIEYGKVKFSSPEKEAAILAIDDQYNARMSKIIDAENDEEAIEIERIHARYGIE